MTRKVWAKIKIDYITGQFTLEELGKKYGVSAAIISKTSTKEGWDDQREVYQEKFVKAALEKQFELSIENFTARNKRHQYMTELILQKIENRLMPGMELDAKELDMCNKALQAIERGQNIERKCFGVDKADVATNDITIDVKLPDFSKLNGSDNNEEQEPIQN